MKTSVKKQALIVLDVQKAIVEKKDFADRISNIESLIDLFKQKGDEIIFFKHVDLDNQDNPLYHEKIDNTNIVLDTKGYNVYIKNKPNAFSNSKFHEYLKQSGIDKLVIVGFNIEFCCMFTAIVAEHEGFEVILIEDACGTISDAETYEMPGLDVYDFVGTVLNWSDCISVLYLEEYLESLNN